MTKIFRKRLVLTGAISAEALAMSVAPVPLVATGSLLDLKVALRRGHNPRQGEILLRAAQVGPCAWHPPP